MNIVELALAFLLDLEGKGKFTSHLRPSTPSSIVDCKRMVEKLAGDLESSCSSVASRAGARLHARLFNGP